MGDPVQHLSRYGIGASEIAAIAGLNPYASPWDVWIEKTGQGPAKKETETMEWGKRLEPAIRQKYVDETGWMVDVPIASIFHPEAEWARATPDGIVPGTEYRLSAVGMRPMAVDSVLVQCKNVGAWCAGDWKEAPPVYVQLQEQWEMYVAGVRRADVAVLIGGNDFRIYTVHRDNEIIKDLRDIAGAFWERVQTMAEPDIDHSDACRDHFTRKLGRVGLELQADESIDILIGHWRELHLAQKQIKLQLDVVRNRVRAVLASAQADSISSRHGRVVWQLAACDEDGTGEQRRLMPPKSWAKENG